MNNFFEQFKNEAKQVRLTSQEKENMRLALSRVFTETASAKDVASPYVSYSFSFSSFHTRMLVPLALVFMVVIGTTGTAYAAQGALPGDLLYPIKVNVTEKVEVAVASNDPVAKAQVHASLAQRRAQEAEVLASQGRLDATISAQLATSVVAEASTSQQITQQIAMTDPSTAAQIETQLSSALQAHSDIIARLGSDSSSASTKENSGVLASAVRVQSGNTRGIIAMGVNLKAAKSVQTPTAPPQQDAMFSTMTVVEGDTATGTTQTNARVSVAANQTDTSEDVGTTKDEAVKMEKRASKELAQAREQFKSLKESLDTDTAVKIATRFDAVSDLLVVGSASLKAGQYGSANMMFTQALRGAVELQAYLKAGKDFKNFLPKLLEQAVQVQTPQIDIPPSAPVEVQISTPPSSGAGVEVQVDLPKI